MPKVSALVRLLMEVINQLPIDSLKTEKERRDYVIDTLKRMDYDAEMAIIFIMILCDHWKTQVTESCLHKYLHPLYTEKEINTNIHSLKRSLKIKEIKETGVLKLI
jgi:hypothetical protein